MADKVEVVEIKDESEATGKLETRNEEDAPDFNDISENSSIRTTERINRSRQPARSNARSSRC